MPRGTPVVPIFIETLVYKVGVHVSTRVTLPSCIQPLLVYFLSCEVGYGHDGNLGHDLLPWSIVILANCKDSLAMRVIPTIFALAVVFVRLFPGRFVKQVSYSPVLLYIVFTRRKTSYIFTRLVINNEVATHKGSASPACGPVNKFASTRK